MPKVHFFKTAYFDQVVEEIRGILDPNLEQQRIHTSTDAHTWNALGHEPKISSILNKLLNNLNARHILCVYECGLEESVLIIVSNIRATCSRTSPCSVAASGETDSCFYYPRITDNPG